MDYNQAAIILGIGPDATPERIQNAFRKLTLQFHPDRPGGSEAKQRELNEAYETLSKKGQTLNKVKRDNINRELARVRKMIVDAESRMVTFGPDDPRRKPTLEPLLDKEKKLLKELEQAV